MRIDRRPSLVLHDGMRHPLQRVHFSSREVNERWIQQLIHQSPDVLPIHELEPSFAPPISLAREVPTGAGGLIDNLLVSPLGRLTIVEAKLWRNPQATREVVAQAVDYAKSLSTWSYEDLEQAIRRSEGSILSASSTLHAAVTRIAPDTLDEAAFIDSVQRSLRTGRFLLLVVGDGIRENVQGMVDALHAAPGLLFTFGLVELQLWESEALGGRLVIPDVVARTTEIVRAVVKVEAGVEGQRVTVQVDESFSSPKASRGRTLSEEDFFASVKDPAIASLLGRIADRAVELGAVLRPGTSELPVKFLDPAGSGQEITLFIMTPAGKVYFDFFRGQIENMGYPVRIGDDLLDEVSGVFPNVERAAGKNYLTRRLTAAEVASHLDDFASAISRALSRLMDHAKAQPE